jgi:hypothetical protein
MGFWIALPRLLVGALQRSARCFFGMEPEASDVRRAPRAMHIGDRLFSKFR